MTIIERDILDYFGRNTLSADENRVIFHYKNLAGEYTYENTYENLRPTPTYIREGVRNANGCATFFFLLTVFTSLFPRYLPYLGGAIIFFFLVPAMALLTIISFLAGFKKHDAVVFVTKDNDFAFSFNHKRHPDFLEYITKNLSNQSTHSIAGSADSE